MAKRDWDVPGTERELCERFVATLPAEWTVYPETAGFDLLLVGQNAVQVGIEAKLRCNFQVLAQALPSQFSRHGPDRRAVLVPEDRTPGFHEVCGFLGIHVLELRHREDWLRQHVRFPDQRQDLLQNRGILDWPAQLRCTLPEFLPDVPAGVPSPVKLTTWAIKALRIVARLEIRGEVLSADWNELGLDRRLWLQRRWVVAEPHGRGSRYTPGPEQPDLVRNHHRAYLQIHAQELQKVEERQQAVVCREPCSQPIAAGS